MDYGSVVAWLKVWRTTSWGRRPGRCTRRLTCRIVLYRRYCFFFFQAEDGIRDGHVTGVQTCALPISEAWTRRRLSLLVDGAVGSGGVAGLVFVADNGGVGVREFQGDDVGAVLRLLARRSEERRVGKECRCWWWPCRGKKEVSVQVDGE